MKLIDTILAFLVITVMVIIVAIATKNVDLFTWSTFSTYVLGIFLIKLNFYSKKEATNLHKSKI